MTEPSCFTVGDLSARWKCDRRVVRDMIEEGQIKTFMVGDRERITMTEVMKYEGEEGNHETDEEKALTALDA